MIGALGLAVTIAGAGSALLGSYAAIRAVQGHWSPEAPVRAAWGTFALLAAANIIMRRFMYGPPRRVAARSAASGLSCAF